MRAFQVVSVGELDEYPLTVEDRLDSHYFVAWERRRWLNSDMRLRGTPECRALFFDLINISYDQAPVGTLPNDPELLAKMLLVDPSHFQQLCRLDYGPLHKWSPVRCGEEIRLSHPMVLRTLREAISRREDHRARSEAASTKKRLQRLRSCLTGAHASLASNDGAVLWIDGWLHAEGCEYRSMDWIERGINAWMNHSLELNLRARRSGP
ncbi:hypothetical protein RGQ15_13695 [Paracoccus sp. MBLB3053]|uniref:Uncharacterized protein n=1 Tax=Paracoccus aurantius TaxID=3073814 RepID=A0ABU2HU86_9RHOB|nr:hypothetical protein [Paracoccus sp. MBLB3053]MDS9468618.1 hypothetical protein [Paracoccus sp. MBLB3053]